MAGCDMNRLVAATLSFYSSFSPSALCACVCVSLHYGQALDSLKASQCVDRLKRRAVASLPQAFLDREAADLEDGYQGTLHATGPLSRTTFSFSEEQVFIYMCFCLCAQLVPVLGAKAS